MSKHIRFIFSEMLTPIIMPTILMILSFFKVFSGEFNLVGKPIIEILIMLSVINLIMLIFFMFLFIIDDMYSSERIHYWVTIISGTIGMYNPFNIVNYVFLFVMVCSFLMFLHDLNKYYYKAVKLGLLGVLSHEIIANKKLTSSSYIIR